MQVGACGFGRLMLAVTYPSIKGLTDWVRSLTPSTERRPYRTYLPQAGGVALGLFLCGSGLAWAQELPLSFSPSGCCTSSVDYPSDGGAPTAYVTATESATISIGNISLTTGNKPVPASNNGNSTLNVTINPTSFGSDGQQYAFGVFGHATQDTYDGGENAAQASWAIGPTLDIVNMAKIELGAASPFTLASPLSFSTASTLLAVSTGADGYLQGQNKTPPDSTVYNGAAGGVITVTNSGSISINAAASGNSGAPWMPFASAIGAFTAGGIGAGGKTNDWDIGGNGGDGGALVIATGAGSEIIIQGSGNPGAPLNGITAYSQGGGSGCDCSGDTANTHGLSGSGGAITVEHSGSITGTAVNSIGISAISIGGDGGLQTGHGIGANPGTSGPGGTVDVTLYSGSSISLSGGDSIGVLAASSVGPSAQSNTTSSGGAVAVVVNSGASISTTGGGAFNIGVAAVSTGSPDIIEPFATQTVAANGSGFSGAVSVTNAGSIATNGQLAIGIAALSLGGSGVFTTASSTSDNYLGNIGTQNNGGGTINVTNAGAISTNGGSAFGILAASNGAGGLMNLAYNLDNGSLTSSSVVGGQTSSNNGSGGSVTVSNSGTIITGDANGGGKLAIGILAQSIGGGGGSSGGSGVAAFVGDDGGTGGHGGSVAVTMNGGQITTRDDGAIGILSQSIGGGGGNGGNAAGVFVAVGGNGGSGGNGGQSAVYLNNASGTNNMLTTLGDFAMGVLVQSVGGGGGNGGYATSAGIVISTSIGGAGGSGGIGGAVIFSNFGSNASTTIITQGLQSSGVIAQSIGGGGGNGGAANAYSVGPGLSISIALGGNGGGGKQGGTVDATNNYKIYTGGADSIGILAQSIGGGGGNGGNSMAKSLTIPAPDDPIPAISFSVSTGGSGGGGGAGGVINVANGGQIYTAGDGAISILAQSIGGGGGNGGDSTATSKAIEGGSGTIKIAISHGGSGGAAGNGGEINVVNGQQAACPGCNGHIETAGKNAIGILAQSIGGGGGNGGAGNSSTGSPNFGGETGTTVDVALSVGGGGGVSGSGQDIFVQNLLNSSIVTLGSGAQGILAQSIGGGGGNAGGGSASSSGDTYNVNIAVGANGGTSNIGGAVTADNAGLIRTDGGDATGIFVQSIGGSGGTAGTADPDASIGAAAQIEDVLNKPGASYNANLGVGGTGGRGGNGSFATVANSGVIDTIGQRSFGILAQSIGGGGGSGGSATASASAVYDGGANPDTAKSKTYSANISVGGSGGGGGNGSTVTVEQIGTLVTLGYGAHGVFAQSIGGGGGVGADGTISSFTTVSVGVADSGSGGSSGGGGIVTVLNGGTGTVNGASVTGAGTILTAGDDAYGILAQSIGGGGGQGSAGCTNSAGIINAGLSATPCLRSVSLTAANSPYSTVMNLNLGGGAGADGDGASVSVTQSIAGSSITTYGARAFGIVAQSIGGGGGMAAGASNMLNSAVLTPQIGANDSTGGYVSVAVGAGTDIMTFGAGAWGILVQSIGGGGGFVGDSSLNIAAALASNTQSKGSLTGNASSGGVTVTVNGNIVTSGVNAHGVFAQSIGGSGGAAAGLALLPNAALVAGNTAQVYNETNSTYAGNGGSIIVSQGAGSIIQTSGLGSIGIFAQSSGNSTTSGQITLKIDGTVLGGTNAGYGEGIGAAGILVSGGGGTSSILNTITIGASGFVGTVDGISGTAILANSSITNVSNAGTLAGSVDLGATPGGISNTGTFNTGSSIVASSLTNQGRLNIAGLGTVGSTQLSSNLTQAASGSIGIDIDSQAGTNDILNIAGTASMSGTVAPTFTNLLPGAITFLVANGGVTGTPTAVSTPVVSWFVGSSSNALTLTPTANFTPAGVAMNKNETAFGNYVQRAWNSGGTSALAPLFGYLGGLESGAAVSEAIATMTPQTLSAYAQHRLIAVSAALSATFSCPVFQDSGTVMDESNCVWARVYGVKENQYSTSSAPGYQIDAIIARMGAQKEIAPNWYLGASAAYETANFDASSGISSASGQGVDVGATLKHTIGPWYFGAGINLGYGWSDTTRYVPFEGTNLVYNGNTDVWSAAGRLRAAYEFAFSSWYLRPYVDVDLVYTYLPASSESGLALLGVNVSAQDHSSTSVSPRLELGARLNLPGQTILRPYVTAGVTWLSNPSWESQVSLQGMPAALGSFTVITDMPSVLGDFDIGFQLLQTNGFEIKAEYGAQIGENYLNQTGTLRLAYHF